jgi:hypothetical protein
MNVRLLIAPLLLAPLLALGCEAADKPPVLTDKPADKPAEAPAKPIVSKKTPLNPKGNLLLETFPDGKRRVLVETEVCFREGPLELLMCRNRTKEHESIIHADIDAQQIHAALLAAKAKPGSPVKYLEKEMKIIPPTGTRIRVLLQYEKKPGETVTVNARDWIRDVKTSKELAHDWVFAGSIFFNDPDDPKKPPYYLANGGDVVSVSNFHDSMLDLPIASTKDNADLAFECWTERIPPLQTKVTMILEPVLDEEKKKD